MTGVGLFMTEINIYKKGEWIVHSRFGIGQIEDIDVKDISGVETDYYRVKTADSTFWIPVEQMDSDILRPLATDEELQQAIDSLTTQPEEMSENYKVRQDSIRQAQLRNTPNAIAGILRDLREYRRKKGILNSTERAAFKTLKQRLAEEWSLVKNLSVEKVQLGIDNLLGLRKGIKK
jgi:RNA polymerase-interacting CarD/CdnL/TRCF family regulator